MAALSTGMSGWFGTNRRTYPACVAWKMRTALHVQGTKASAAAEAFVDSNSEFELYTYI